MQVERIRKITWINRHYDMLFVLWEQSNRNSTSNGQQMYEAIAGKMRKCGLQLHWKDVRSKIDNLNRKYKEELREIKLNGGSSSWRHFERIHKILAPEQSIDNIDDAVYGLDDLPLSSDSETSYVMAADNSPPACPSPAAPRKLGKPQEMTPFELAMLEIERDRTDRLESIAMRRLEVMQRMAAENAEFHKKLLTLVKSKK